MLLQTLYLVKWLGWDREEDLTWEPLEHLQDPDGTCQALEIFEKKEGEKERLEKEKALPRKRGRPRKIEDEASNTDNDDPTFEVDVKGKRDKSLVANGGKKKAAGSKKSNGRAFSERLGPTILCPNCGQEFHRHPKKGGYPG